MIGLPDLLKHVQELWPQLERVHLQYATAVQVSDNAWVRTVHTECLDWILVCNRRHLEHVLARYVAHYNTARPHRGIDLDVPVAPAKLAPAGIENVRRIERVDVLGGLVHEYRRAA